MIDWEGVEKALKIRDIDEGAAETFLREAIGVSVQVVTSGSTGQPASTAVDYGVDGYSDVNDPRQPSAQRHAGGDSTPTTGVHVLVLTNPSSPYRCSFVAAYGPDHQKGGGRTLILVDQDGGRETVVLGTGASKVRGDYDQRIEHMPRQDVVIAGSDMKFYPPNLGGASVFLQGSGGEIISDEVRSMGLANGDHMVFEVRFEKR